VVLSFVIGALALGPVAWSQDKGRPTAPLSADATVKAALDAAAKAHSDLVAKTAEEAVYKKVADDTAKAVADLAVKTPPADAAEKAAADAIAKKAAESLKTMSSATDAARAAAVSADKAVADAAAKAVADADKLPPEIARLDMEHKQRLQTFIVCASFLTLGAVIGLLLWYMRDLRDKLADAKEAATRELFPTLPMGLPDGSVRAAIGLVIVLGTLFSVMASGIEGLSFKSPEALTGVLGTILGFYFGRTGAAENAQTKKAISDAATGGAEARKTSEALDNSQRAHTASVATISGPVLSAAKALIASLPTTDQSAKLMDDLTSAQAAIEAAKAAGKVDDLKAAFDSFRKGGPIASIVTSFGPALAPLVPGGTTASALQALAGVSESLPPTVAPRWIARLLNTPYRDGLIAPVINDDYAGRLIARVPKAPAFVQFLQTNKPTAVTAAAAAANDAPPPLTPVEIVTLVLSENAVQSMAERWAGHATFAADWGSTIEGLQRQALEMQLESEIPADLIKPLGNTASFFRALEGVQASGDTALSALDFLTLILRAAREAGTSATNILPDAAPL